MKLRKRYFLLILLAVLPFYKLFHPDNYCFGDLDLALIGLLVILFIIVFLTVFFYNLYKITLKKELFNFRPLIIAAIFTTSLYLGLEYHDENVFKNKLQVFKSYSKEKALLEINLFDDNTFELKIINEESFCVEKGKYHFKRDTLFLNKYDNLKGNIVFDDVYIFNEIYHSLNPIYSGLPTLTLEK